MDEEGGWEVTARTDNYPLVGPADQLRRMEGCSQVHPGTAIDVLRRGFLVFALCPDRKWRRVKIITVSRPSFTAPNVFRIAYAACPALGPHYSRSFNKNGILLLEVPAPVPTHPTDLTGD